MALFMSFPPGGNPSAEPQNLITYAVPGIVAQAKSANADRFEIYYFQTCPCFFLFLFRGFLVIARGDSSVAISFLKSGIIRALIISFGKR